MNELARKSTVNDLLTSLGPSLANLLGQIPPDYFLQVALGCIQRNPQLLQATRTSLLGAILQAAQLQLILDPVLGEAYLVPFWNRTKGQLEVQFVPGYRGLLKLARDSDQIARVDTDVVMERDYFEWQRGLEPKLVHRPALSDRGPMVRVWALAVLRDGSAQMVVMSKDEVERIKARSAAVKQGKSSPWDTDEAWMWRKTALKQLCKLLPLTVRAARAVGLDDRAEAGLPQDLGVLVQPDEPLTPDHEVEPPIAPPQAKAEVQPPVEAAPAAAACTVAEVREATRNGRRWWIAKFSDQRIGATADPDLGAALAAAAAAHQAVADVQLEERPGKVAQIVEVRFAGA